MGNEQSHPGDGVPARQTNGNATHQHRRSTSSSTTSIASSVSGVSGASSSVDPDVRPTFKRSATMGPSTSAHITISPPPPTTTTHTAGHYHKRDDSLASNSSDDAHPFNLPPAMTRPSDPKSSSVLPPPPTTKRNQYLSIDFQPASSNSSSPQSHPMSAPPSLIVSPLSASLTSNSSSSSSGGSSGFTSSTSSLSLPPREFGGPSSGCSTTSSSSSSSPRISAMLREHAQNRYPSIGSGGNRSSYGRSLVSPTHSHSHVIVSHSPPSLVCSQLDVSSVFDPHSPATGGGGRSASSVSSNTPTPTPPTRNLTAPPPILSRKPTVETLTVHTHYNSSGQKQINQYVIEGGEIGRGSYGTVKLVFNTEDQQYYAMKIMNKSLLKKRRVMGFSAGLARTASLGGGSTPSTPTLTPTMFGMRSGPSTPAGATTTLLSNTSSTTGTPNTGTSSNLADHWMNVQREIAISKRLIHPNIVRLYEVMDDPSTDNLYLIQEYMSSGAIMSGELSQLRALPLDICWSYLRDIILGLEYLHFQKVIHRDLKPENLLRTATGKVKITDFGVSMLFEGDDDRIQRGSSTVGSAAFLAPELCGGGLGLGGSQQGSGSGGIQHHQHHQHHHSHQQHHHPHHQPQHHYHHYAPSSLAITPTVSPTMRVTAIGPSTPLSPFALLPGSPPHAPTPALLQAIASQQHAAAAAAASSSSSSSAISNDCRSFSLPIGLAPHSSSSPTVGPPPLTRVTSDSHLGSTPSDISGKKGDLWSLGVTLYVMIFGRLPFFAKTVPLLYRTICEDSLTFPTLKNDEEDEEDSEDVSNNPNQVSEETHPELIDLLHRLMDKNPNTRIGIRELKKHPWVTKNGTQPMEEQCDYGDTPSLATGSVNGNGGSGIRRRTSSTTSVSASGERKSSLTTLARRRSQNPQLDPSSSASSSGVGVGSSVGGASSATSSHAGAGSGLEATAEAEEAELTDTDEGEGEEYTEYDENDEDANNAPTRQGSIVLNYQPISVTSEDVADAVTLVSRVILVVKLKTKMRRARLQLAKARARSSSVGDATRHRSDRISGGGGVGGGGSGVGIGVGLSRPILTKQVSSPTRIQADDCLSPSLSTTEHISVPITDISVTHSHSTNSTKRHALKVGGDTQALLQAARGAITAAGRRSGERNADSAWEETPIAPDGDSGDEVTKVVVDSSSSSTSSSLPARLALSPPMSPLRSDHPRLPIFPHRKGSAQHEETPPPAAASVAAAVNDDARAPPDLPSEHQLGRHQSAPLGQSAPFYYVPYDRYVQSSLSCTHLTDEQSHHTHPHPYHPHHPHLRSPDAPSDELDDAYGYSHNHHHHHHHDGGDFPRRYSSLSNNSDSDANDGDEEIEALSGEQDLDI